MSYESGSCCRWAQTQPPGAHELSYNVSSTVLYPIREGMVQYRPRKMWEGWGLAIVEENK